jgi:hypothetical protein
LRVTCPDRGERGRNVSFHRYVLTLEITLAAPGASNEPATPADAAFTQELTSAMVGKLKAKKGGTEYTVERVKKV